MRDIRAEIESRIALLESRQNLGKDNKRIVAKLKAKLRKLDRENLKNS